MRVIMPTNHCRHIKEDGVFCQSPALRGRRHCYFHLRALGRNMRMAQEQARQREHRLVFPPLEDMNAVQVSVMQVLAALGAGHLEKGVAGLMLYGLQQAANNLRSAIAASSFAAQEGQEGRVEEYPGFEQEFGLPPDLDLEQPPEVAFPQSPPLPEVELDPEVVKQIERDWKYRKVTPVDIELEHLQKERGWKARDRRLHALDHEKALRFRREDQQLQRAHYVVEAARRNAETDQRMRQELRRWERETFGPLTPEQEAIEQAAREEAARGDAPGTTAVVPGPETTAAVAKKPPVKVVGGEAEAKLGARAARRRAKSGRRSR